MSNEQNAPFVEDFFVKPSQVAPTLFVGLGGAGCKLINRVYKQLSRRPDFKERYKSLTKFAYVDTNIHDLEKYREVGDDLFLISDFEKAEYSRLAGGKAYLDADDYFTQWVPQNYRFRSGDTAGAGQIRIESRLGVYYQVKHKDFVQRFRKLIEGLKDHSHGHRRLDSSEIRIVLCYSVAGGTGSGSHLPIAYLLKELAAQFGKPILIGMAALPSVFEDKVGTNKDGVFANGYAAMKETEYLMKLGAPESKFFPEDGSRVFHYNPNDRSRRTVDSKPFEVLWVVDRPESFSVKEVLDAAADAIYLQMYTPIYGEQAGDFDNYTQHQRFLVPHDFEAKDIPGYTSFYGGIGAAVLHIPDESLLKYCAQRGSLSVIESSFLQGIPGGDEFKTLQQNPRAFFELEDLDGSGRMVHEATFGRRSDSDRKALQNRLFQKRVRMLANAEMDADQGRDEFARAFVHGHGDRVAPDSAGRLEALNLGANVKLNKVGQKMRRAAEELAKGGLDRSMGHFALKALDPAKLEKGARADESAWKTRLWEDTLSKLSAGLKKDVEEYAASRSGTEPVSEYGGLSKSERPIKTERSVLDAEVKRRALGQQANIAKLLDRPDLHDKPEGGDWMPGFRWLEKLVFINASEAKAKNLVEKRYAVLSVLDRVDELVKALKKEKDRREEAGTKATQQAASSAAGGEGQKGGGTGGADGSDQLEGGELVSEAAEPMRQQMLLLEDALFLEYSRRLESLVKKLDSYATVFTDLQSQFLPFRTRELEQAEKLRIEGTKDETDAFELDGEALQMESGRRMWDFYFEDQVRNLGELYVSSNKDLAKVVVGTIEKLVEGRERGEQTPPDALTQMYKQVSATIAGALRTRVVGNPRSKSEAERNGLTLLEALRLEVMYRALYLSNRDAVDTRGLDGVAELVMSSKTNLAAFDVKQPIHGDYLRDKLKRLIKERSDLLCYLDEKHLSQGGVRPDEVFLAAIHKDLHEGLLKEVLNESLGIQPPKVITKDVEDKKAVVFYRAILNVPLYVFGRLKELRACYYQFKGMAKRSKVLHIDKNWEDTLPDLDPASVEEAHRQQRIRDSVLDFAALMNIQRAHIFNYAVDEERQAEMGISGLVDAALAEDKERLARREFKQDYGTCILSRDGDNGGRVWALRFPLEEQFLRMANGASQAEVEQDEPVVGSYVGEAILRVQAELNERPQMYAGFREICALVREGMLPRVIRSLIRVPGEWRKFRENLKARYGRNPREDQQRMLEDIDNVQQKLTDALLQLYETLDLRRREAALTLQPVGTDDAPGQAEPGEDPVSASIQLLSDFKNSLKSQKVQGPRPGSGFNPLFQPIGQDEVTRKMGRR